MRIGIDAHSMGAAGTGNRTYVAGLIGGLASIDHSNEYLYYAPKNMEGLGSLSNGANFQLKTVSSSAVGRLCCSLPLASLRHSLQVLHAMYFPPIIRGCGLVLTIHDVCFEHYPSSFSWKEMAIYRRWIYWGARQADVVITISEFSKQDIVRVTGISSDKVVVIPLAAAENYFNRVEPTVLSAIRQKYRLPARYLLFVGRTDDPRKNIEMMIRAYALLRQDGAVRHHLVIAGRHGRHTAHLMQLVDSLGLHDVVCFPGIVPEQELPGLMAAADAFLYPSLFEGFGLPILEAMASGTPVITSDRSSLPEVAGEAALIVSGSDVNELANAILRLVHDRALHARLSEAGRARAQHYSWARAAQSTLDVYEAVYERRRRRPITETRG
jgi:glycosyltransferase involved in cell wall biosynthesis